MRILNLEKKIMDDLARVSCRVIWEDCDAPEREIYIETQADFADALEPLPDAFLVGTLIPAMHLGEQRIRVEEAACPRLKEGLNTVMGLMQVWSRGEMKPLQLESGTLGEPRFARRTRRTAMFLSGGIDSLAALRLNRLHYDVRHPGAVQDCLLVHGFDIGGVMARGMKYHVFERALEHMAPVARDAGVTLIPVYTNIRQGLRRKSG